MKSTLFRYRLLFLALACAVTVGVVLFLAPRAAAAEADATVYINAAAGDDTNSGLDESAPVKTFGRAYDVVYAKMAALGKADDPAASAKIVLTGDTPFVTYGGTLNAAIYGGTSHVFRMIITSKTGSEAFSFVTYTTAPDAATPNPTEDQAYLTFVGPTTIENITVVNTRRFETLHASEAGDLTIGEGVTCTQFHYVKGTTNTYHYVSLVGSPKLPVNGAATGLIVHSGAWQNLYAVSYTTSPESGSGYLFMDGGSAVTVGSTYNSNIAVSSVIRMKNVTVTNLYAAHALNSAKTFTGDVTLDLENVTVTGAFALDAGASNKINGDLYLSLVGVNAQNELDTSTQLTGEVHQTSEANVPEGETVNMTSAGTSSYHLFNGGGTLVLGQDSTLEVTGVVTGSTEFSVSGGPLNRVYIKAPASTPDSAFVYTGSEEVLISTVGSTKQWSFFSDSAFRGLVLYAPTAVNVSLYTEFKINTGSVVTPDYVRTENGIRYQYYSESVSTGNYRCVSKGTGYYNQQVAIYLTAAKLAVRTEFNADPGLIGGNGFEPASGATVKRYTDETMQNVAVSDDETWAEYDYLFVTPSFNPGKAAHEFTTQEELISYVASLDDTSKDAYQFTLARSETYDHELPIIVFTKTDLSGCSTWQEAAALVKANDKITVHYDAQIHGNEPAGGEGALIILTQLYQNDAWREELLDKINLYLIPRVNTDGSQVFTRNTVKDNDNMNRDYLTAYHTEVQALIAASNEFDAYVRIDGHEYTSGADNTSGIYSDIYLRTAGSMNCGDDPRDLGIAFILQAFSDLGENGLRASAYPDVNNKGGGSILTGCNPTSATLYQGLDGALSFLVETRGINDGRFTWKRRLVSQYVTIKSLIDQAAERAAEVKSVVEAERDRLVERGETYDPAESFVLEVRRSTTQTPYIWANPIYNFATGTQTGTRSENWIFDVVVRSRSLPTAYVLPKGEAWEAEFVRRLTVHGIAYYEIEPGATVMLRQYTGTVSDAGLSDETCVTFPNGAFVIPMNQTRANVAAYLCEPDTTEGSEDGTMRNSMAQTVDMTAAGGGFAIYRYEHDLESDGTVALTEALPAAPEGLSVIQPDAVGAAGSITGLDPEKLYEYRLESDAEYTAVSAGSSEITGLEAGTYFVRFAAQNGDPASLAAALTVEAYTEPETDTAAVYLDPAAGSDSADGLTEETAKATLAGAVARLAELISGDPALKKGKVIFLSDLSIASTGVTYFPTHSFPLTYTGKTGAEKIVSAGSLCMGGDTTLEHITVRPNHSSLRTIFANGKKLVIGQDVNSLPYDTNKYFNLAGGGATSSGTVSANCSVTIYSGTWRTVYAGSYQGKVVGDCTVDIYGGSVAVYLQCSYTGSITGNVTFTVRNASIGTPNHMGLVQTGTVNGNVTLILAEGAEAGEIFAGNRVDSAVTGISTLVIDGAAYSGTFHGTGAAAATTVGASRFVLKSGSFSGTLDSVGTVLVDTSAGGTLTLGVSVSADTVTGGGSIILKNGSKLTVTGSVTGSTALSAVPATDAEVVLAEAPASVPAGAFTLFGCCEVEGNTAKWILNRVVLPDPSLLRITGRTLIFDSTFSVRYLLEKSVFDAYLNRGMTVTAFTVSVGGDEVRDLALAIDSGQVIRIDGAEYYWVKVDGIAPKDADTRVSFSLILSFGGETYKDVYEDSVKAALEQATTEGPEAFRAAANATLAYCAAAAENFGKDASAYVFTPVADVTDMVEIPSYFSGSGTLRIRGTSLILKDELAIRFWVEPGEYTGSVEDLVLKVNGVQTDAERGVNGKYFVFKIAVPITAMDETMTVELFANGESVSNRYTDSVLNCAYCISQEAYGYNPAQRELGQAVVNYVRYANAYLD